MSGPVTDDRPADEHAADEPAVDGRVPGDGSAAERLRRTALEVAELGVVRFDLVSRTVTRDARAAVIAGREPHELGPYEFGELFARVHPEDLPVVKAALAAGAAGERRESRFRWVRPDDSVRDVVAVSEPERADGAPAGAPPAELVVTLRDVTDENRAFALDARLRRLFETDLLGIFFFGYDGSVTTANDAFLATVGYTREDLDAGRVDWAAMTPPDYAAQDAAKVEEVRATGRCQPFEKEYVRRDGTRAPVLIGAAGVDAAGGVCFSLDLSERKRLEREGAALSEQRRIAFETADLGVCRFDFAADTFAPDGRAAEVFGFAGGGPRPIPDLMAAVHPDDAADVRRSLGRVMEGEPCEREFRVVRPSGEVRTVYTVGVPVWAGEDHDGPPAGMTATLRDVTETAEAVRRTAMLAAVLENAPDFIGVASADRTAEFINRAGREMLGRTAAEIAGVPVSSLHTEASNELLQSTGLPAALRDGRWAGETELLRADGTTVPVSQAVAVHRDGGGAVTHISTICRDLTERVRAEEVSAARRECLSRLAAGEPLNDVMDVLVLAAERHLPTPNLVCVLLRNGAAEGRVPATDTGGAGPGERLRLASAPSLPDSFKDHIDGLAADETGGACGAAAVRGEAVVVADVATDPLCAQFREFLEDHELRAVWSTPIRGAGGAVLGTFAVYHDHAREPDEEDRAVVTPLLQTAALVVERAGIDARVKGLVAELAASEAAFRGTFENVGVGVAHVGFDGAWLRVNRRLCEIVGYPEDELRKLTFQDITYAADLESDMAQFGKLLNGAIDSYTLRKRYVRKTGELIWIQLTVAMQRSAGGEPEYAISVIDDISEKVAAEETLQELNATLELRVASRTAKVRRQAGRLERLARGLADAEARERRRLAHAVHDDLQQILAAAKMCAARAAASGDPTGAAAQAVELLDESINEARALTQDLVPTVLYDRGLVPAVAALCRRTEERFRADVAFAAEAPDGETPGGQIDAPGAADGPPDSDLVDRDYVWGPLLYQAARELLFNAVKHASGAPVRVTLGRTGGGGVRLTVSNPAPPPDAGFARPLTAPHDYGAAGEPETRGDGFGLFSLREQAGLAGGRMRTARTDAGGFTATLTLPPAPMADLPPPAETNGAAPDLRVMIVDDHRIVRSALAGLLGGTKGILVVGEAADGQEAVDRVAELNPDAVVMDVTMPRMDGIEATRRVKEILPNARVVGLSMHTRDDMAEAMCDAGAEAYVPKGGPPEELVRALRGNPDPVDCCDRPKG